MKLLIADDEYLVIESIKYIIERNMKDVQVVGTAGSGREAIEKVIELKPDVVFMDIHMPGIDGIDAIRQIKAVNQDVMFIIITAYEYFNYAKEALNLGVYEYLLKPLNKNKVIETMDGICKVIKAKHEAIQRELQLKEKISKIIPHMEGQFIYSQIFDGRAVKDLAFYESIFGFQLGYGYVMMAIIDDTEGADSEENLKNSLIKQKFYDMFSKELKNMCRCLVGPPLLDRVVAFLPADSQADPYVIRNTSIQLANRLAEQVSRNVSIPYKIGLSRRYEMDNFSKSCTEAYTAASVVGSDRVTHFEDIAVSFDRMDAYPTNKEKLLIHKLLTGDQQGVADTFEEIFFWLTVNYKEDMDRIKSRLIELIYVIKRAVPYCIEESNFKGQSHMVRILKLQSVVELKSSYMEYLRYLLESMAESRQKEMNGLISKVIKYIHSNYQKNISLDDAAKEVNLSYHYFSKFFKESMGKSFIDYLTEIRIESSKVLLKDAEFSIKEIGYRIGYSDPNYYCKTFKKVTGMTPTEYRTSISGEGI